MTTETTTQPATGERADILETLAKHRFFLRFTLRGLSDEQARQRTTVSVLHLGGLIKHVSAIEESWVRFILGGPEAMDGGQDEWELQHQMLADETIEGLLARYDDVARKTDEVLATLPDLDVSHPLPEAPWFEAGARWSARRVFLHLIGEISQHAGHADIIRESLDGAKSMG